MRMDYIMFLGLAVVLTASPLVTATTRSAGTPPTILSFLATPEEVFNDGEGNITFTVTVGAGENITQVTINLTPLGGGVESLEGSGGVYTLNFTVSRDFPPGIYNITVTVKDNESEVATAWVEVQVNQYNRPPEVRGDFNGEITVEEDSGAYVIPLEAVFTDPDGDELTYTLIYSGEEKGEEFSTDLAHVAITGDGEENLTITPAENAFGILNFTVSASDGEYSVQANISFSVSPQNDPPTASINKQLIPTEVVSGTTVVLLGDGEDPDGDPLNFSWNSSLEGFLGYGKSILVTLTEPGEHNITLRVSDGEYVASDWVLITVTEPPKPYTLTEDDVTKNYTDPEEDEIWWETKDTDYIYHRDGQPSYDIVRISSWKEGDDMVIRIAFRGTPAGNLTDYVIYFVKPGYREEEFDKALPSVPSPTKDEYYLKVTNNDYPPEVNGNDLVFTIPLEDLEAAGISNGTSFELFVTAGQGVFLFEEKGILDTAGYGAVAHEVVEGERHESFFGGLFKGLKTLLIICVAIVVIIVVAIILVIVLVFKKKGDKTTASASPTPPPGEGMPPTPPDRFTEAEGGDVWVKQPPQGDN